MYKWGMAMAKIIDQPWVSNQVSILLDSRTLCFWPWTPQINFWCGLISVAGRANVLYLRIWGGGSITKSIPWVQLKAATVQWAVRSGASRPSRLSTAHVDNRSGSDHSSIQKSNVSDSQFSTVYIFNYLVQRYNII